MHINLKNIQNDPQPVADTAYIIRVHTRRHRRVASEKVRFRITHV